MPTQLQVQNTILSAQFKMATLTQANLALILNGGLAVDTDNVFYLRLNLNGLTYQNNRQDYTSSTTIALYNRLIGLIGIDTTINNIDPNYQNPTQSIIVVNSSIPSPIEIQYSDMTLAGTRYDNALWKGYNPFMVLDISTFLQKGVDYTLLPSGGFILNPSGGVPAIFPGQIIRALNYQLA